MNKVSKTIKLLRQEKNITQDQLAEALCVTRQAVSNWETDKTQPDIETLTKLADYFEVSVEQLIYGEEKQGAKYFWSWTGKHGQFSIRYYPEKAVGLGVILATVISYVEWRSIGWAILHGLLNWGYVIYYIIRY